MIYIIFKKHIYLILITLLLNSLVSALNADDIIDIKDREKELQREAELGNTDAQFTLGRLALESKTPPDHSLAVYWFRFAAESNHIQAQEMLGAHFFSGLGVPANPEEAYNWWHKAAIQGSEKAQASLGVLYALGSGVKKDIIESYKWLTIAAINGNQEAQIQRDESIALQMTANEIREAQKRINETLKIIKK